MGPGLRPSRMERAFSVCGDLDLDLRDGRRRGFVLRARLLDGHLGNLAVLELQLEEPDRICVVLPACVWQLPAARRVRAAGYKMLATDGDKGKDHAAPRLLGGEQVRLRCLGEPPDAAPEVDLPGGACQQLKGR